MIDFIQKIRKHYSELTPEIFRVSKFGISCWTSPYGLIHEWVELMSPIEYQMWQSIRMFSKVPMYPQYPVDKFFLDFGNPVLKIGIECDGKEYHQDKLKDRKRDQVLDSIGWVVFRIPGSDCIIPGNEQNKKHFYLNTIEGLLKAIAVYYFKYKDYNESDMNLIIQCLNSRASLRENKIHGTFR